ncbi:POTRA domain-containing protein [Aestuariibaculum sp. YM273]|uniref:POTRA domain-containing protein n=1 Tax=Aestuariibaculum sp. YM273 TaxID=3070659 RepID=UPI0027DE8735|nr:POTRA domain-containing protein [Aestuariibaculum sp. YM273]WMI66090.1 POTRA domain-containing protein [Aestuariibaculum sp. YM273]
MIKKIIILFVFQSVLATNLISQNLYLTVKGGNETENKVLEALNYNTSHLNYLSIKKKIDSLQNSLQKIGFIENEHSEILKLNDSTFSTIFNLKNQYQSIHIYYSNTDINPKVLTSISRDITPEYFTIAFKDIETTLNFINKKQTEEGYPFSKLKLTEVTIENVTTLKGTLITSSETKKRQISNILIKGYEKFPESFLKHFLKIKPGQLFNLNEVKEKTSQLNNLRFATETKSPEVLFSKDSTTLYLYLEKTKSNAFDGFLGFGTNEDTNQLQFDGYLNLNLTNNLNYGETLRLLYKSDENEQKTFEANASLPYLFKTPIGLDLLLRIFKKDSSFTTVNQSAKLHYQINPKHKIYTGVTLTESNNLLSTNIPSTLIDYTTNYYTLAYEFKTYQPNNLLFPLNTKFYIESNFGSRKQDNNNQKQSLFNLEAFKILNINLKNSVYFKLTGGILNSDDYLENELMRFGGINSIRGFEENSIYASLFNVLNTEYRYQLSNSIYIHSITDIAYYKNQITDIEEKLYGFGFGFGIFTKAGLLKLNYANGKNENTAFKISNSKIHISLTASF